MILKYTFAEIAQILTEYASQDAASQGLSLKDRKICLNFRIDPTKSPPTYPNLECDIEVDVEFKKVAKTG